MHRTSPAIVPALESRRPLRSAARTSFGFALALALLGTAAGLGTRDARAQPFALGTAFTYQGSLTDGASPANGAFDFEFALFDDDDAGSPVGSVQSKDNVVVTQGVFTVSLDFGAVFTGERRWLAISVRPGDDTGAFTPLLPRVEISAAPHALFALDAADAANADALDGMDSTAFAVPADLDWNNLANVPADFADGTDDDGDAHSLDASDGDPTDALFVDAAGRVGVGTTTPEAGIQVATGRGLLATPTLVSETFNGSPYTNFDAPGEVQLSGSVAYVTSFFSGSLTIVDVSDPSAPVQLGVAVDGGAFPRLGGARSIAVVGTTVYVTAQSDNALTILDASDPSAPALLGVAVDGQNGVTCLAGANGLAVSGTTAYVASLNDDAICILDVSNPASIVQLGQARDGVGGFTDLNGAIRVEVVGSTAYAISNIDDALTILDVSDPSSPQQLGVAKDGVGVFDSLGNPRGLSIDGATAYVSTIVDNAVTILDVSDSAAPALLGVARNTVGFTHLGEPHGLALSGTNLFVAAATSNAVTVIDVADPTAPVQLGVAVDGAGAFTRLGTPLGVAVDAEGFVHVVAFTDDALTILDPEVFPLGLRVDGAAEIAGDASVGGDLEVTGAVTAATFVGDGSGLTGLSSGDLGEVLTQGTDAGNQAMVNVASLAIGTATASEALTLDGGDFVQTTAVPASLANFSPGVIAGARTVFVRGDLAYVTGPNSDRFALLDVSVPSSPVLLGSIADTVDRALDGASGVFVSGRYAYVTASLEQGLEIVDVSNPASPTHVGAVFDSTLNSARGVYVQGGLAYVAAPGSGLAIVDVSNPASPTVLGSLVDDGTIPLGGAFSVQVVGALAYVAAINDDALCVIDVSDPAAPTLLGSKVHDGTALLEGASGVHVVGRHAYVASQNSNALEILDVSNAASPVHVGSVSSAVTLGNARSVVVAGRYAYVTSQGNRFTVVDVSTPSAPVVAESLSVSNLPVFGTVAGPLAFAPEPNAGSLRVIGLTGIDVPTAAIGSLRLGSLFTTGDAHLAGGLHAAGGIAAGGDARVDGDLSVSDDLRVAGLGSGTGTALVADANGNILLSTSSARFKTNVEPAGLARDAEKILALEPVHYEYTETGERSLGLIAEDLHALGLTDLVNYDRDGKPWSIAYEKIPLFQNELIKRLSERSAEHEAALAAKDAELARLRRETESLRRENATTSERLARIEAMLGAAPPLP